MKIAVLGQRWNPYLIGRVRGGGERVEAAHLSVLSRDHEIHFITSSDSDEPGNGITTYRVGPSKYLSPKLPKGRTSKVCDAIRYIKPDVVLCHDNDNPGLNQGIVNLGFPVLHVAHTRAFINGIMDIGYVDSLYRMKKAGHTICSVSEFAVREWNRFSESVNKHTSFPSGSEIFTRTLIPAMVNEKPELKPVSEGLVCLGRFEKLKKFERAFPIAAKAGWHTVLFAPPVWSPAQQEFMDKILSITPGADLRIGRDDKEIFDYLSRSTALLTLAPESFGLTAVEANSYGVPVILFSKDQDHPILEGTAPGRNHGSCFQVPFSKNTDVLVEFLRDFKPLPDRQREAIIEETWNFYKPSAVLSRLVDLLQDTIETYRKNAQDNPQESALDVLDILGASLDV